MKPVLLVGVGPLPAPDRRRVHATGLRLQWFLRALQRAHIPTLLGEIYFSGVDDTFLPHRADHIVEHRQLIGCATDLARQISEWTTAVPVSAIVALTDIGALAATRSVYTGPLHVDYFGHPMAERAQQAHAHDSDASLHGQWLDVLPVLLRADRFSVCSAPQRSALLGELGAAGRLNRHTVAHEFVEIVPPALPFDEPLRATDRDYLYRRGIPRDARIVAVTGGYNTWLDEETLFHGIEQALGRDDRLHFVSTGGAIEGHVTRLYERFQARVAASPLRSRMHLLGWLPHEQLNDVLLAADVGVNADLPTREGEFGCRNRLWGWLWAGMRVVTTVSSESTQQLVDQGWARAVPFANPAALADAILAEATTGRRPDPTSIHPQLRQQWGDENHLQALVPWLQDPAPAPDRAHGHTVHNPLADLQRQFLDLATSQARHQQQTEVLRQLLARLEGSRAIALYRRTQPQFEALLSDLRRLLR